MEKNTHSWSLGKLIKYSLLPKPKGSPKAGKKEIIVRITIALIILLLLIFFEII